MIIKTRKVIPFEIALVFLILVLTFVVRLYYLLTVPSPELTGDAANYDITVKQLLDKGIFGYSFYHVPSGESNALITPGYPFFLAIIYKTFGYSLGSPLFQVRVIQVIISSLTAVVLYFIAKKLFKSMIIGAVSAIFYSVYIVSIWVPTLLLTETLYTFIFLTYMLVQIYAISSKLYLLDVISGVIFALAVLVRPAVAPLIVLPYAFYFIETKDKRLIKGMITTICAFAAIMSIWWVRNYIVLHDIILTATQEDPLLRGTYPYYEGVENMPTVNQKEEAVKRIIKGFSKEPLIYLKWYTSGKFTYLYLNEVFYYVDDKITTFRDLLPLHHLYVKLGWIGVLLSTIKPELRLISLYICMTTLIHLGFVAVSRYSYPIMPLLILLTGYITGKVIIRVIIPLGNCFVSFVRKLFVCHNV